MHKSFRLPVYQNFLYSLPLSIFTNDPLKTTFTYRPALALFLAALIVQIIVLKEVHLLLSHHHEQAAHCNSAGPVAHLHSEEYAPADCHICFFHFAPANLDTADFSLPLPVFSILSYSFSYHTHFAPWQKWHFRLRGPPSMFPDFSFFVTIKQRVFIERKMNFFSPSSKQLPFFNLLIIKAKKR